MAGKEGSPAERMSATADAAAALVEQDIALLQGFDPPKDAAGVERRAKALGAVLICARRTTDLAVATAKALAADEDPGPEEDDPDDEATTSLDPAACRAELKRRHAGWDAIAAAGGRDRRLDAARWSERAPTYAPAPAAAPGGA